MTAAAFSAMIVYIFPMTKPASVHATCPYLGTEEVRTTTSHSFQCFFFTQ